MGGFAKPQAVRETGHRGYDRSQIDNMADRDNQPVGCALGDAVAGNPGQSCPR